MYERLSSLFIYKMRETFISLLLFSTVLTVRSSDLGKDGFNYYKDYLRTKSEGTVLVLPFEDRMIYFRTPLQLYPELPALQNYIKRTANIFKHHMLNRELEEVPMKRTSKTGLSLLMQSKQDLQQADNNEHYCIYG